MEKEKKKKEMPYILQLAILVVVMLFIRMFVMGTIYVMGVSMEPNFHHGDWLFINKLELRFGTLELGDVVICNVEESNEGHERIIKRVIGVPGDVISLVRTNDDPVSDTEDIDFDVYLNGEMIDEPYIKETIHTAGNIEYPFVVPEGCYFVMGDNRNNSWDSRKQNIGAIPKENIEGKVFFRLYPFDSIGFISYDEEG